MTVRITFMNSKYVMNFIPMVDAGEDLFPHKCAYTYSISLIVRFMTQLKISVEITRVTYSTIGDNRGVKRP